MGRVGLLRIYVPQRMGIVVARINFAIPQNYGVAVEKTIGLIGGRSGQALVPNVKTIGL